MSIASLFSVNRSSPSSTTTANSSTTRSSSTPPVDLDDAADILDPIQEMSNADWGTEASKYQELLYIISLFCTDQLPILDFVPAAGGGKDDPDPQYSNKDYESLKKRDFRTRLFFSDLEIKGNNAWIRTHHTDCAQREHIDYVREYFEAAYTAENHIAAKATLTGIMDSIFNMENQEYYNFATILASGLSNEAKYTAFEVNETLLKGQNDSRVATVMARRRLTLLMNIIFAQISTKRFLDDNCNIFRLVHAETKGSRHKGSLIYVAFSFLLQSVLGVFVIAQVLRTGTGQVVEKELKYGLYVLATLGSMFGFAAALPEIYNWRTIYSVYGSKFNVIYVVDVICNVIIPLFLVVVGWWIVTLQADYINGVIMTTALLFM